MGYNHMTAVVKGHRLLTLLRTYWAFDRRYSKSISLPSLLLLQQKELDRPSELLCKLDNFMYYLM